MNSPKYTEERLRMINELNTMLRQAQWDMQKQIYLDGEKVSLLIDPLPAESINNVHVPITVVALIGRADELEGVRVALQQVNDNIIHYGHLNRRGQLLLRDLPTATYQIDCAAVIDSNKLTQQAGQLTAETKQLLAEVIEAIPLQTIASRTATEHPWQLIYHSSTGILKTIIQQQTADTFNITFESPNRKWDGALLGFTWQAPSARIAQRVEPLLRFAVLSWDEARQVCTTELRLTSALAALEVGLPVKPYPPEQLTAELMAVLQASVQGAATEQARQGWRHLLEVTALPANVASELQSALDPMPRSLWKETSASVFQLTGELRVEIGRRIAQFVQIPASLPLQTLAASATRASDLDPTQGQVLTLDSPEHDLSINLSVLPGQEDKTAMLGIWINQPAETNVTGQIRVILRDEKQHILASESIASDGRVDFSNLVAGLYWIEVKQRGKTWQWSIPVTVPDERLDQERASGSKLGQRSRSLHDNHHAEQLLQTTDTQAGEVDKQKQARRYPNIDFPTQCQLDQPAKMSVQLALHPVTPATPDIPIPVPLDLQPTQQEQGQRSLELLVMVSSRAFTVEPAYRTMQVPFDRDSEKLEFSLTGHQLGEQLIEVRFFHETARVGYVGIKTTVATSA